ncbi:2OG-Fe(II) oxygenase [Pseudonocardia sp.]|uniref:2OG-Fe(II) oxygenase n=1 Tax=Pseudonocardia sp. TaxID=60912 RepID=UPI0031FD4238
MNFLVNEQRWAPELFAGSTAQQVGDLFDGDLLAPTTRSRRRTTAPPGRNRHRPGGVSVGSSPQRSTVNMTNGRIGMSDIAEAVDLREITERPDWEAVERQLDEEGFAATGPLLSAEQCREVVEIFDDDTRYRSTVTMARHAFGEGRYRYFDDPLPELVQQLREGLYPPLAAIANRWADRLGERAFPATLPALLEECAKLGQHKPTPLVLRYGPGGYNNLHQDVYGELTFPLQFLIMLSQPDEDFTGGESVFVEQRPRQQSRPMVARPRQGEAIIFPVRHRPKQGSRGHYRVQMRHGVSAVHAGERHVLGIIFHNAR